jgi:cytochrome P450
MGDETADTEAREPMQFSDFASPRFYADPYPLYQELRAAGPLVSLAPGFWITGWYPVVDALLRDRRLGRNYQQNMRLRYGDDRAQLPVFQAFARMLLLLNPPAHTRLRALLMQAFNVKQVVDFRQLAQGIAEALIDQFAPARAVDLVQAYAFPLPIRVICTFLDVPYHDAALFTQAVSATVQALDTAPMDAAQLAAANHAIEHLQEYFTDHLRARRRRPGHDLISLLLTVEEEGQRLTEEEIVANIILLFIAGHETTTNMIGNALVALHRHPAQLARAQADAALLPAVVGECLRYDGAVQMASRTALDDLEIAGQRIARGQGIFLCLGAANRDPAKFAEPDRLRIDRPDQDARLLTFGGGIHYCLGARLAMVELEVALGTLFRRVPQLQLTNLDTLTWHPRNSLRGVQTLTAVW